MTTEPVYHVDGELIPADEATVSVRDRGFLYGDAAFETVRAYGGHLFEWSAHLNRLEGTVESLGMAGAIPNDLETRIHATLDANDLRDAYVRLSVTRGVQSGRLTPTPGVDPTVVIIVEPLPRGGVLGSTVWDRPATVHTVDRRRVPDDAIPADAKTHNYLNGILAHLDLEDFADEALLRGPDGTITEGATSNVFFVANDRLHTPSLEGPVLPGVTRRVVLDIADELDIPAETGAYSGGRLRQAEELFLTNTTWELRPVAALDGEPYSPGPVTARLERRFRTRIERLY